MPYVFASLAVVVGWIIGNLTGYHRTFHKDGQPFSWRIFLGPRRYMDWLGISRVR